MSLRRADGFVRYAVSLQYHGASFLGFSYQGSQEDAILPDGTDLRGYRSVEGRLREGFDRMFSPSGWENIQVSSRTDRGVHALKNTFHVDVKHNKQHDDREVQEVIRKLQSGLNYLLARQTTSRELDPENSPSTTKRKRQRRKQSQPYTMLGEDWCRYSNDEVRILAANQAPDLMVNHFVDQDPSQPPMVDWNARFSTTERTYIYRILSFSGSETEWGVPFEWDRSWRIRSENPIDSDAMKRASKHLQGTHDFSTFRAANCQRQSPIVTMKSVQVHAEPYGVAGRWGSGDGGLLGLGSGAAASPQLVTIKIVGESFLYRQVRNMVACLVEVGRGKLQPADVQEMLESQSRSVAPGMAPAQGLFLVDVQHGDFDI